VVPPRAATTSTPPPPMAAPAPRSAVVSTPPPAVIAAPRAATVQIAPPPSTPAPGSTPVSAPVSTPAPTAAPVAVPARAPGRVTGGAPVAVPARAPGRVTGGAPVALSALTDVLGHARKIEASDVHIVAERPLLFRTLGELQPEGEPMAPSTVESWAHSILPAPLREVLQSAGSCDLAYDDPKAGRFRANVSRQRTGLKICMRVIGETVPSIASLGLPESLAKATHHHQGLIVVTGPTSHGKTCTLNALLELINRTTTHHVITVEDPVEYVHPRVKAMMSQREVGTHTRSFASALKGSLREDPDVIAIGEMRDTETVRMALSASETGHLVIATMNTPSAAKTIDRLIDMFPPADQTQVRTTLAGALRMVVSQRLIARADGRGMAAAVELLPGSIALWSLIRDGKTFQIPSLQQRGKALGIIRLDDSLSQLVRDGVVSMEAARPYVETPEDFDPFGQKKGPAAPGQPAAKANDGLFSRAQSLLGKKG
jgi:twitching motility protein PilT